MGFHLCAATIGLPESIGSMYMYVYVIIIGMIFPLLFCSHVTDFYILSLVINVQFLVENVTKREGKLVRLTVARSGCIAQNIGIGVFTNSTSGNASKGAVHACVV